jgi:adenylate cyclase
MACLEMRIALNTLNENRISRGEKPLMIGMGVHFGEAIAGTIGSDERIEYTVIGDTVNIAARIEASTKAFGTDFLVSGAVAEVAKEKFILKKAGDAKVKGKTDALAMYKILGYLDGDKEIIVKTPYSDYEASGADKVEVISD